MEGKPVFISLDIIQTGERIHHIMIEKGYSVRQVQEILHLSCPQTIYKWMCESRLPSVDNLYRLSRLFDMHMEDLLVELKTGVQADNKMSKKIE